jgi:subtilisin family serine protease
MKSLIVLFMAVFTVQTANAEKMIVRLKPGTEAKDFRLMGQKVQLEELVAELGIYAVEMPKGAKVSMRTALSQLRNQPQIAYAQEDHPVTMRSVPNDKSFSQQWDMKLDSSNWGIDAVNSWANLGQGGLDAAGNEIVVAVVDGGVDLAHQDLKNNIWVNKGEIPGNNIDDDKNGYVDDINGWNAYSSSGDVESDYHGTHVAGTVGAVGNNVIGVAGVNWNVKIMAINGSSGTTSVVLKAYGYVLKQKKLWLQTGGKQGANIVATNSSFGVDYGNCKSPTYAAWNDIYNEMGQVGILHAIATANLNINVDKEGDVPTGCDSPYIVAVTNTQKDGSRNSGAGYGVTMIDLGAPGTNIYSTLENDKYGNLTGTSMATPHVAGAIAYLHSAASSNFNSVYLQRPADAVLELKEIMLKTVTPAQSMAGKTVSGGILNVNNASQAISVY